MKKLLALTLTLCMVLSLAAVFGIPAFAATDAAGNKTCTMTEVYDDGKYSVALQEGDTVTIGSSTELLLFVSYVNTGHTTGRIIFRLTADVTLGNQDVSDLPLFTPAGNTEANAFAGIFNGDGHKITNLYVQNATGTAGGLFGYTSGAAIENLSLVNVAVSGKTGVGALIGTAENYLWMRNISTDGKISADRYAGGFVGYVNGNVQCINSVSAVAVSATEGAGGLIGKCNRAVLENCLLSGRVSGSGTIGILIAAADDIATGEGCYYYTSAYAGEAPATGDTGKVTGWDPAKTNAAEAARVLGTYCLTNIVNGAHCYGWTANGAKAVLTGTLPEATVAMGQDVAAFGTFFDAVAFATKNTNAVLTLLTDITVKESTELGGTYTLDFGQHTLTVYAPLTVSQGTLTITGKGAIKASGTVAVLLQGGSLKVNSGSIVSSSSFAIRNTGSGSIRLSGTPWINGASEGDIYVGTANTLFGNDGTTKPTAYTGSPIRVKCGFRAENGAVIAAGANADRFIPCDYDSSHFVAEWKDGNMIFSEISYWIWWIVGALFAFAAVLLVVTIVKTARFKERMKTYSFLPIFPLAFFTTRQYAVMIVAGAALLICLLVNLILGSKQKKQEAAAKAKKAETPAEEPATEETPAEEPVEEPKEEEPAEEPVEESKEEEPAEEPVEESKEEEPTEEPAEESKEEEPAEEPVEESKEEEPAEEPAEESKEEEPAEEPAEESKEEEPAEEPVEESKEEEPAEEPKEEEPTEEPAEETAEESAEEATEESEESGEDEQQIPVVDGNPSIPAVKGDQVVVAERDASGNMVYSIYKKSFTARLIQSDKEIQERYEDVKNALLSYKKVNSRVSWSYDSFKSGHDQLAKITIRGKTPYLYLAIDPATLEGSKYNVTDAGKAKKYSTVPCRLRLTSKRSVKWATELIDQLAEKKGLVKDPKFQPASYVSENETTEALIEKGLIKKAQ